MSQMWSGGMYSTQSAGIGWVIVVSKVWHGYENTHSVWAMGCAGMGTVFEIVTMDIPQPHQGNC